MNSEQKENLQNPGIMGESVLAIISVALAAFWIAFAYYHGGSIDANGNRIMLLHPLVPIALIGLLIRIYKWVGIKFVVQLEIIMIGLWLFVRLLGIMMPFILGFGFAYLFRFLWKALPLKKYYQRAILTALIIMVCSGVLVYTGFRVSNQVVDMTKGLQKFYHETVLPLVVGEDFSVFTIDVQDGTETYYLGTDHGIYILQEIDDEKKKKKKNLKKEDEFSKKGITNGGLVGKKLLSIAVNDEYIYAGTLQGLYRCNKGIVQAATGKTKTSLVTPDETLIWKKIENTPFENNIIQVVNTPVWNQKLIFVGTDEGLFESPDSGISWKPIYLSPNKDNNTTRNITNIHSIEKYEENRKRLIVYVASTIKKDGKDITEIHRRHADNEWEKLFNLKQDGEILPRINMLVATRRKDVELYAATVDGMWQLEKHLTGDWEEMPDSSRLPKNIALLVSAPSGFYAGNKNIIHHRLQNSTDWNEFRSQEEGVLRFRDEPFIKQFESYLTEKIPGWTAEGGTFLKWLSGLAGSIAFQFGGFIATVFLAFIVFVYASQGLDKYFSSFLNIIPERHRETTRAYLSEIDRNMHQFLKGQFTVIVIVSIISCLVYRIIGVPFALLIGILAGLCNAIPTFGPFIGGGFALIAMLMGLAASEFVNIYDFLIRCVFVLGAILGIQTIDNSLISPKVMSNAVDVDPLLIMFAVIVGASILGFWGVLLAIPIIVVIKSIITVSKSTASGVDPPIGQEES